MPSPFGPSPSSRLSRRSRVKETIRAVKAEGRCSRAAVEQYGCHSKRKRYQACLNGSCHPVEKTPDTFAVFADGRAFAALIQGGGLLQTVMKILISYFVGPRYLRFSLVTP